LHFHRNVHEKTILYGERVLNRTNISDIFCFRNAFAQALAGYIETTRCQGIVPKVEKAIPQRDFTADLIKGYIDNLKASRTESLE
jgi:hypothetical protein